MRSKAANSSSLTHHESKKTSRIELGSRELAKAWGEVIERDLAFDLVIIGWQGGAEGVVYLGTWATGLGEEGCIGGEGAVGGVESREETMFDKEEFKGFAITEEGDEGSDWK